MQQEKKIKNHVSQVTSIKTHTFFESDHEMLHNPSQHIDRSSSSVNLTSKASQNRILC
ncbi:hypothetical protein C0J52_16240 [Blattella germanica]|nr:hypothetical protein C0J52_16240 [Blattella germanica]